MDSLIDKLNSYEQSEIEYKMEEGSISFNDFKIECDLTSLLSDSRSKD